MFGRKISVFGLTLRRCSLIIFLFADKTHVFIWDTAMLHQRGGIKKWKFV